MLLAQLRQLAGPGQGLTSPYLAGFAPSQGLFLGSRESVFGAQVRPCVITGWLLRAQGSGFVLRPVVANRVWDSGPSCLPVTLYKGRPQLRLEDGSKAPGCDNLLNKVANLSLVPVLKALFLVIPSSFSLS